MQHPDLMKEESEELYSRRIILLGNYLIRTIEDNLTEAIIEA